MKFIARETCYSCDQVISEGRGETREEAVSNCLNRIHQPNPEVFIELEEGVVITEDDVPKTNLPEGLTLVFFHIWDHCAGGDCNSFTLGVKPGTEMYSDQGKVLVGDKPIRIGLSDQAYDASVTLPEGSVKCDRETGQWVPRTRLRYDE